MRIHVLSDLHFEVHADGGEAFVKSQPTGCDVLVLAGDICTKRVGIYPSLERFRKHYGAATPIVYVRGNHEHWGEDRNSITIACRKAHARLGVFVLENEAVTIAGVRFLGTTLWFPKGPMARQQQHVWCDFLTIPAADDWLFEANDRARSFLNQELRFGDVVITHHLPSARSVDPKFLGAPSNCYYVNELDDLIRQREPQLWIHGHTHCSQDYALGGTRIVCNPYGYETPQRDHMNPWFEPGKEVLVHAPGLVHLCTYGSQPDIQIACDGTWTTPSWTKATPSTPGVYRATGGRSYTFEAERVTCPSCQAWKPT